MSHVRWISEHAVRWYIGRVGGAFRVAVVELVEKEDGTRLVVRKVQEIGKHGSTREVYREVYSLGYFKEILEAERALLSLASSNSVEEKLLQALSHLSSALHALKSEKRRGGEDL